MRPLLALLLALVLNGVRPAAGQPVVANQETTAYATAAGAAGLTFGADGRLFIGRDAPGSTAITEQLIFTVPPGGGATTEYGPFGIADPLAVLVDADATFAPEVGSVIVSGPVNATSGQIVAIKPSAAEPQPGATIAVIHPAASPGIESGGYIARLGNALLIADAAAEAVVRFPAPAGPPVALISTPGVTPRFLAVREPNAIFVSYDGGTIRRFDAAGVPVGPDPLVSGLAGAVPIAVAPAGADFAEGLYAVEGTTGKLFRIADDGTKTEIGTQFPSSLGEIEFGPDGALYVAAFSAGRVYRIGETLPPPVVPDLGPFLCYNAKPASGSTPTPKVPVGLVDAFETRDARIGKAKAVCSPATVTVAPAPDVENEDVATLASYQSRWVPAGGHAPQTLSVTNALGTHSVQTLAAGADRVLVPSGFNLSGAATALPAGARDYLQCYKARLAPGTTLAPTNVDVADPVGPGSASTPTARTLVVKKPKHVCIPVDADLDDTDGTYNPDDLLVCYAAKPAKGEPKTTLRESMGVNNILGAAQTLEMLKGSTTSSTSTQTGTVAGDVLETFTDDVETRPGEWDLDDSEGPRWSGGGPLGEGDSLKATFSDAASLPVGTVRRFRVFVTIDIAVNDTNEGPGVTMRSSGIPGIPDGSLLVAKASGKPAGIKATSAWFDAPSGATLADLAESEQTFEPNGDGSSGAFAFQIKDFGIQYEMSVTTGGARTGVPEAELCLPSTTP